VAPIATKLPHNQKRMQQERFSVWRTPRAVERKAQVQRAGRLQYDNNCNPNAGVTHVKEKILSIDVVDVAVVGIGPAYGPGINDGEPISTVLKTWLAFDDGGQVDD
jgi:hypothetical protein